jgi:hypothetical protein
MGLAYVHHEATVVTIFVIELVEGSVEGPVPLAIKI